MKETLDAKKDQIDLGDRARRFIHRMIKSCFTVSSCRKHPAKARRLSNSLASEDSEFSDDEVFSHGHHRRGSQEPLLLSPTTRLSRQSSARYRRRSSNLARLVIVDSNKSPQPRFRDILTKQVILNMVVYSGLALHNISFDQLFPLLCSTKIRDGGLGMTAGQIGVALSVTGVMAMVLQVTLFPWGHNKFGGLFCLRVVLGIYAILYFVQSPI